MTDRIRSLLDAARVGYEPSPDDRARVKQLLLGTPGALTAAAATSAATQAAATARATASAVAIKAVAASVLVGTLSFGAGFATGRRTAPASVAAPTPSASAGMERAAPPSVAISATAAPPAPIDEAPAPAPAAPSPVTRPSASSGSSLWEEAALLREAQRALQGGDAPACLAILDRMAARYPSGGLGEERSALRILALCGSGRQKEARALGAAFLERYPGSVHAARVRASCAASEP